MSDKKYPEPPVDPNLVVATGKSLGRDMNPMERAIAARFSADPRKDSSAKEQLSRMYPVTPDGVTGDSEVAFDPNVDAVAKKVMDDFEVLGSSEAAQFAAERPPNELPEDRQAENNANDLAASLAAEVFGEDGEEQDLSPVDLLDLQFAEKGPEQEETPTDPEGVLAEPTGEMLEEDTWPEQLPRAIMDMPDLVKVLDFYNLSEDQVIHMILAQEKPLTPEGKKTIWDKEVEMAGFSEEDINEALHEFLSKGCITREYSFYDGAIRFGLRSRSPKDDRVRDSKLSEVMREHEGFITPDLEEKHQFLWKAAGSLWYLRGFGHIWSNENPSQRIEQAADFIDKLPSVGFQLLCQAVSKLDNLAFFAAQKMSIENF